MNTTIENPWTCKTGSADRRTRPIAVLGTLLALALFALPATASASHFRYGQVSWEQTSGNAVEIQVTTAWRSDFVDGVFLQFGDGAVSSLPTGSATLLGTFSDATGGTYSVLRWTISHTYANPGPWTAQRSRT